MPFINMKTNIAVTDETQAAIKTDLGQAITAIPGKSEDWLMVGLEPNSSLWFKGTNEPAAMVEVSIFGSATPADYEKLTKELCNVVKNHLNISPARTYVKYSEIKEWGWNNQNF
ncbi:MAG: phenylpyruvate tautomerase MIF-related protein [bacterium]|nr:phenylpyruvate tautomerase MIF-related protein [bacterium]